MPHKGLQNISPCKNDFTQTIEDETKAVTELNKKGQKNFKLHRFLNTFSQMPAAKKYSKNGADGKFLDPSYFDPALGIAVSA